MFIRQVHNLAGDCAKTHRWCLVNLTDDDANADRREKLSQRRIIGIGRKTVRLMANNGSTLNVDPHLIQRVW